MIQQVRILIIINVDLTHKSSLINILSEIKKEENDFLNNLKTSNIDNILNIIDFKDKENIETFKEKLNNIFI